MVQTGWVFLMRVSLPDRPGALGLVASAVGTIGADIHAVEIVAKQQDGIVIDDFMLTLPDGAMPDNVVSACREIEGVRVLWLSRYPEGGGLESDIELLERMSRDAEHAAMILTDSAPTVFHGHWAALINTEHHTPLMTSAMAPEFDAPTLAAFGDFTDAHTVELADGWLRDWGEVTAAVAPVGASHAVILGRQGGPAFLTSEVARLRHLAAIAASTLVT